MESVVDHSCSTFIRKLKNDSKMTKKPDWSPLDVYKRLTYKRDTYYNVRLKEKCLYENILEDSEFRSALALGTHFFCCIKTVNMVCEPSNKDTLRIVSP